MISETGDLVVHASRGKLVMMALGSAAFVATGIALLTFAPGESIKIPIVATLAIVFFGACGAYAVRRLLSPQPAVVINREGIVDNASATGVGLVRWDEIAELCEYTFQNQTFLGIVPKNLDRVLERQPAWKRTALRANSALGVSPINIPQAVLPMPVSELLREIQSRYHVEVKRE
jgi:hypothetical protein